MSEDVTLEMKLNALVENYGWERLDEKINIRCFTHDPWLLAENTNCN